MQNRYKKTTLIQIVRTLEKIEREKLDIKYPIKIKKMTNGIGLKVFSTHGDLTLCFYQDHPTSEVSIIKDGMRYIYSRRDLRLKRHVLDDLINTIAGDDRLYTCRRVLELVFVEVIKIDQKEIVDSVYLG